GVHRQPAGGVARQLRGPRPQAHPQLPRRALPGLRHRLGAAARPAGARARLARPAGGGAGSAGGPGRRPPPAAVARRGGERPPLAEPRPHARRRPAGGRMNPMNPMNPLTPDTPEEAAYDDAREQEMAFVPAPRP